MGDIIIILGPPCAGKGTICKLLAKKIHYHHLSIGEALRTKYPVGSEIRNHIDAGNMVTDDIIMGIFEDYKDKNIILDGFPRSLPQIGLLREFEHKIESIFVINAPVDLLIHRMQKRYICDTCGIEKHNSCNGTLVKRDDDNIEIYKKRYEIFQSNINLILNKLQKFPLKFVNNSINVAKCLEEILEFLASENRSIDENT